MLKVKLAVTNELEEFYQQLDGEGPPCTRWLQCQGPLRCLPGTGRNGGQVGPWQNQ